MNKNHLKYRLILDVDFDSNGTDPSALERNLKQVVRDSVNNGTLAGETPATVELYDFSVKRRRNRHPKRDVVAYARKNNTPSNAQKLKWVDDGPYEVSKPSRADGPPGATNPSREDLDLL